MLASFILTSNHNAGWNMGDTNRGLSLIDMLTTCTTRTIGIHLQICRIDLDIVIIIDFRHNLQRCKRSLSASGSIKRRDSNQSMNTVLRFQKAIGIGSGNQDRCALDTCFLSCQIVQHLYLKVMALTPTGVHAVKHLNPVLCLSAASSCMEGQNCIICIKLAGKQRR